MEFIPTSEIKCSKSGIFTNNDGIYLYSSNHEMIVKRKKLHKNKIIKERAHVNIR